MFESLAKPIAIVGVWVGCGLIGKTSENASVWAGMMGTINTIIIIVLNF